MQKTRRFWIAALALLLTVCLALACVALSIPQAWALTGSDQTGEFGSVSVVGDYFRDVGRGDLHERRHEGILELLGVRQVLCRRAGGRALGNGDDRGLGA